MNYDTDFGGCSCTISPAFCNDIVLFTLEAVASVDIYKINSN